MGQSVALNSGVTARNEMTDAAVSVSANGSGTGNYVLDHSADFTFGGQDQQADLMDFTFDPITTPGSEDMLAAMQAIQNPTWWHTVMMPGSVECVILCVILVRLIFVSVHARVGSFGLPKNQCRITSARSEVAWRSITIKMSSRCQPKFCSAELGRPPLLDMITNSL